MEETGTIELRDGFYRDSIGRVVFILISMLASMFIIGCLYLYLILNKPAPIVFPVDADMRVLKSVPLTQPYLSTPEMLQWVANVFPDSFTLDFNHYNDQLKAHSQYFTSNGWTSFLNQLNIYANYNNVQAYKLFITAKPSFAPYLLRPGGVLPDAGKFGWWVQMPVTITYDGFKPPAPVTVAFQILVVRVPTLNNLNGVGIDNVIQAPATTGNQEAGNQ